MAFDQLIACVKKNVRLKVRDWKTSATEVLLPIVFIVGTVLIWIAFGKEVAPANQFISYTSPGALSSTTVYSTLRANLCYNDASGAFIDGLTACTTASFSSYACFGADPSVPVTGLCYNSAASFKPGALVSGFMQAAKSSQVAPIALDDMVLIQWVARFTLAKRIKRADYYTQNSAILMSGRLYFAPDTADTAAVVTHLNATSSLFKYVYGGTYPNVAAAASYVVSPASEAKNWAIIDIQSYTPTNFHVELRLNHTAMPQTTYLLDPYYLGGTLPTASLYLLNGFYTLQNAISRHYLMFVANQTATTNVQAPYVVPMGYAAYDTQPFLAFGGQLAPLIIVLGFTYPVAQLAKRLVLEKELRIREAMHIMGLRNSAFYGSWILVYAFQYLLSSIVMTVVLKHTYVTRVNNGVLFFCFFFFQLSTITLSGMLSSVFSKARIAAIVTPLLFTGIAMPLFAIPSATARTKRGLLLLSPTAFANGVQLIFDHELGGGLGKPDLRADDPSMLTVLVLLAVDTILYGVLWVYFDAVIPGDWGSTRHPLFFILDPVRWCCDRFGKDVNLPHSTASYRGGGADGRNPNGYFEESPVTESTSVQILGLRKEFERGEERITAVDNLYWNLDEGNISVLLGHNGAGKSTTINMMTGLTPPDGGDCIIYGHSLRRDLSKVRQDIGYCPQHNILWPDLSCAEHLEFFAQIKGVAASGARQRAIDDILAAVDLLDKRHDVASSLSGGQKRKLSVAIAFVGGARFVILDEPTAGMDLNARRHTWELLRRMSTSNRTILLTSHFLDECDLLANTIAIMSKGSLQCSGSSLFLKSRLGVGYDIVLGVVPHVDKDLVDREIRRHVAEAELVSSGSGELTYRLPTSSLPNFPALMRFLESRGASLGVRNFAVSATTLEEVFLRVAHGDEALASSSPAASLAMRLPSPPSPKIPTLNTQPLVEMTQVCVDPIDDPSAHGDNSVRHKGARLDSSHSPVASSAREGGTASASHSIRCVWNVRKIAPDASGALFASQLRSMLTKRWCNSLRDRRTQCLQIISPVACVLLAMLFTLIQYFSSPAIVLSSDVYGGPNEINLYNCGGLFDTSISFSSLAQTEIPAGMASALDLSNYLMNNANAHGSIPRYEAMACSDTLMQAAISSPSPVSILLYNTSANHELPIAVHNYYNAIYRSTRGASVSMTLVNNPMPKTSRETAFSDSITSIIIGIIILIPFTFIPSTFVSWVVKERECKARHLQNVSGLGFGVYWLSNFLFDMVSFVVTMFLVIIVFAIFNRVEYVSKDAIGATVVLFFLYGLSGVSFSYLVSFFFDEHSTAQNITMLANFFAGFLLVLLVFILSLVESTANASKVLSFIFRVLPAYCLGDGIINLALHQLRLTFGTTDTAWSMNVTGWDLVYMALEFPVVFAITLFIDHPKRRTRTQALLHDADAPAVPVPSEDADVMRERYEVEHPDECHRLDDLVRITNLRKVYDNGKVAVKNLSMGIRAGEVFGFLGTNGAGKTTTISILCQEYYPTSGHAWIAGHDIVHEATQALQCIGYCPQIDALLDLLTVEEHLYMYAGVRGIVREDRDTVVAQLASLCELTEYMKARAVDLSGGNKRKLSVAISFIGGPRVVFLDEPSAGLDPVARRGLWTAISTVASNCSVVLCSHHMEEQEALADRLTIMVDGALYCIGTKQHLKHKFGSGFEMTVKVIGPAAQQEFEAFVRHHLPRAVLNECRSLRYTFALPQDTVLSETFGLIEAHKAQLRITDYTISQTSIEQVFLRISAQAASAAAEE